MSSWSPLLLPPTDTWLFRRDHLPTSHLHASLMAHSSMTSSVSSSPQSAVSTPTWPPPLQLRSSSVSWTPPPLLGAKALAWRIFDDDEEEECCCGGKMSVNLSASKMSINFPRDQRGSRSTGTAGEAKFQQRDGLILEVIKCHRCCCCCCCCCCCSRTHSPNHLWSSAGVFLTQHLAVFNARLSTRRVINLDSIFFPDS